MYVFSAKLSLYVPNTKSLKDKRSVSRSVIEKARNRFNASISEVGTLASIRQLTLGISVVSGEASHAQNSLEEIIRYIEKTADAEVVGVERF
ncbi:MAG: DUF503 domain-containing protein [Eubacteriaceae bacterium]|nr:DUF503 domain-containing protein [Eubacteriaceae bacterium]